MDYLPWIALSVAGYAAFHQRKQTQMMEAQLSSRSGNATSEPKIKWWKTPALPVLAVLVGLAWWPGIAERFGEPSLQNPAKTGWGAYSVVHDPVNPQKIKEMTLSVTLDGHYLNRYSENFNIMAVAIHYYGDQDIDDVPVTERSASFNIRNEQQTLLIKAGQTFLDEINKGLHNTSYFILVIPDGVIPENFRTFRQAKRLGVKVLTVGGGPP